MEKDIKNLSAANFKFKKQHRMETMYQKIRQRLIENGYKPIATHVSYSFVYKRDKFPYRMKVIYQTPSDIQNKEYQSAA